VQVGKTQVMYQGGNIHGGGEPRVSHTKTFARKRRRQRWGYGRGHLRRSKAYRNEKSDQLPLFSHTRSNFGGRGKSLGRSQNPSDRTRGAAVCSSGGQETVEKKKPRVGPMCQNGAPRSSQRQEGEKKTKKEDGDLWHEIRGGEASHNLQRRNALPRAINQTVPQQHCRKEVHRGRQGGGRGKDRRTKDESRPVA